MVFILLSFVSGFVSKILIMYKVSNWVFFTFYSALKDF